MKFNFKLIFIIPFIASCSTIKLSISENVVNAAIQNIFPQKLEIAIAEVEIENGTVRFSKSYAHITADFNVAILGETLSGRLQVKTGVRYNKENSSFYLKNLVIEDIYFTKLPEGFETDFNSDDPNTVAFREELFNVISDEANTILGDLAVYTLNSEDDIQKVASSLLHKVIFRPGKITIYFKSSK